MESESLQGLTPSVALGPLQYRYPRSTPEMLPSSESLSKCDPWNVPGTLELQPDLQNLVIVFTVIIGVSVGRVQYQPCAPGYVSPYGSAGFSLHLGPLQTPQPQPCSPTARLPACPDDRVNLGFSETWPSDSTPRPAPPTSAHNELRLSPAVGSNIISHTLQPGPGSVRLC